MVVFSFDCPRGEVQHQIPYSYSDPASQTCRKLGEALLGRNTAECLARNGDRLTA
jgi:hypothetical protein